MPGLEETVGLDIEPALAALDQLASSATETLGNALSGVVSDFSSQLTGAIEELSTVAAAVPDVMIPVDADTASADEAIAATIASADGTGTVTVDADTAPAEAEVVSAVAAIDAQDATITVDADTSAAEEAISGLGDSLVGTGGKAAGATSQVGELVDKVALLGAGAKLGAGEVGGLGEAAGALGGGLAVGALAAGGLAAGLGVLIEKGLGATSMLQRFDAIVGDSAEAVLHLQVGNLDRDLDKLAITLGTDDEALRNASATLFQFAVNSGASHQQAALFTNQIDALAARAVALNPALGSVADVAESLSVRIARGGRFAASYGLSLNAAEIATRALADTGKSSAADLSIYEKAVAGAEIATAKYGATLDETITKGAKNAAIEQRSLKEQLDNVLEAAGKPLVSPFLAATKSAIPDLKIFAETLGEIGADVLPLVVEGLQIAEPVLQATGDVFHFLNTDLGGVQVGLLGVGVALTAAGVAAGPLIASVGGLLALKSAVDSLSDSDSTAKQDVDILSIAIHNQGIEAKGLFEAFKQVSVIRAFRDDVSLSTAEMRVFDDIAKKDTATAQLFIERLVNAGRDVSRYQHELDMLNQTTAEHAVAVAKEAQAVDQAAVKIGAQAQLARIASDSLQAYANKTGSASQALKDLTAAQQDENDQLALFQNQLEHLINPSLNFEETLQRTREALSTVTDAYSQEIDKTHTATQVNAQQRDSVIAAVHAIESSTEATYAKAVADGDSAGASLKAATQLQLQTDALEKQLVQSGLTKQAADDFLTSLGLFPGKSAEAAAGLVGGLGKTLTDELVPALVKAGSDAGEAMGSALKNSLVNGQDHFLTDAEAKAIVDKYKQPIVSAAEIGSPSKLFAREIGLPLAQGIAVGLTGGAGLVTSAASGLLASPTRGSIGVPSMAGSSGGLHFAFEVNVHDVKDQATAQRVGAAVADGFLLAVEKQNLRFAVRTG